MRQSIPCSPPFRWSLACMLICSGSSARRVKRPDAVSFYSATSASLPSPRLDRTTLSVSPLDKPGLPDMTSTIASIGTTGATVWFTGLPSAGKTTLASALAQRLTGRDRRIEILDGDAVRPVLSPELGYSRADRDANVARIGWVASLLARNGVLVLASVVSPFADARNGVRRHHQDSGSRFLEVHVATPVDICADRDVKGLYAKQRAGNLAGLTGIDGEYEAPSMPELRIDTSGRSVDHAVDELIALLEKENLL
jgi:adenylylsulfate kinase